MTLTSDTEHIINTGTLQRLETAIDNIGRTAGLGIIKGPVGIGKSFALSHLRHAYSAKGFNVVLTTARPETEGSITLFINDILGQYSARQSRTGDAVEALRTLLLQRGRSVEDNPSLLIIDESQGLRANVLEMLRGLYDEGDQARRGRTFSPAFGLMLVGNPKFLSRSQRAKRSDYDQLIDRVSFEMELDEPSAEECLDFATSLAPSHSEAASLLAGIGMARGNLRGIEKAAMQARFLAGRGQPITPEHVKAAEIMMTGRV